MCPFKVHLTHSLPDDRLHVVVPLVMSVCEVSSPADEAVLASLSFQFGKLCSGLAGRSNISVVLAQGLRNVQCADGQLMYLRCSVGRPEGPAAAEV